MHNSFFWIFVAFFSLHEICLWGLFFLNASHLGKHEPDAKSVSYTIDRTRWGRIVSLFRNTLLWLLILSGFFGGLETSLGGVWPWKGISFSIAYCGAVALLLFLFNIPVSLYSHFVLEEKYGFNRMTGKTFVIDLGKSLLLGAILVTPLLAVVFWLYRETGPHWWLWAFGAVTGFEIFLYAVYPTFLAPLFNRFKPLEDEDLKQAIFNIAKKIGFKLSGIFVMDGSKRSAHSNAYFAGIGRFRRIVLFDTLLNKHARGEIITILAHEMGHNIRGHVVRHLVLSTLLSLTGFWILSRLIEWSPFYATFGAGDAAPHKALVLIALFSGFFTFVLTPFLHALSRRFEYEADRFAVESTGDPTSMKEALTKLARENLSVLNPHPWYSFFHYSHPTTPERIRAIDSL